MLQDCTSVNSRKVQVQHEDVRCRSVFLRSNQEGHRRLAVIEYQEIAVHPVGLEGFPEKVYIGGAVLGEKNRSALKHTMQEQSIANGSLTQRMNAQPPP